MTSEREPILRRIVVEYGRRYVYAYWVDAGGRVLDEEAWQQPFRLEVREAVDEAKDCWDILYSHLQDTVLWSASDALDDGSVEEDDAPDDEE